MQQDLFSEVQTAEQTAATSCVSPYDIIKEERNKVEKIQEESLFGSQPASPVDNGTVPATARV